MDPDDGDEPGPSTSRHKSSEKVVRPISASNGKAKRTRTIESSESEAETVDVNEDICPVPPELPMTDARFKPVVVEKCLARGFTERKTKVSKETLAMVEWTTRIFVLETICRASKRAQVTDVARNLRHSLRRTSEEATNPFLRGFPVIMLSTLTTLATEPVYGQSYLSQHKKMVPDKPQKLCWHVHTEDHQTRLECSHLESILPQLLLDFG